MIIHVTGKNIEISDSMSKHLEDKLSPLSKRFAQLHSLHVMIRIEQQDQTAEITAHIDNVKLYASASSEDMYHSIDLAYDKILGQLTKHKERIIDQHR